MELSKFYSQFQEANPEKFNEDLIYLKENDNILEKVEDACKSLEILDGITFNYARMLNNRVIYEETNPGKNKFYEVDYESSRLIYMELSFTLEKKNKKKELEKEDIKLKLAFPRLMNGCYYYINNVRYYPIYQIIDAETYKSGNSLTMRTSLQPIVVAKKNITIESLNYEGEIKEYYMFSKIFKVKVPIFNYFFAKMGIEKTLEYFSINEWEILDVEDVDDYDDYDDKLLFKLGKYLLLAVPIDYIDDVQNRILLLTFLNAFKNNDKVSYENINNIKFWLKKLGSYFTKNTSNFENKGLSVQSSFERLLDDTTKRYIRIPNTDKKDIYTLLRWLMINYNNLLKQNNDDLANKRLRLNECFIYPLIDTWTQGVLRILNGKNNTIEKLRTLFSNINEDFFVKKIVNNSDNLRYMNNVNSIDLGNKLKLTIAGNQSISNSKGEIRGKTIDISMLGRVDLVHTSNNDPGTTRMLTPFCELTPTWHFTESPNIEANSFDEDEEEDYIIDDDILIESSSDYDDE